MLRIMSNNQWRRDENAPYWAERGWNCSAEAREKGFAKLYAQLSPDVVGLQETSYLMAEYLMRELQKNNARYALLWGHDTPIIYRPEKLEVVDYDYLVYPESVPEEEGSFNNSDTKSYCAAVFRIKASGSLFAMLTTHLWWQSDDPNAEDYQAGSGRARTYQLSLAIKRLDEMGEAYHAPRILLGDLNTPYDSAPIRRAFELGYVHAHDAATDYASETDGMHYCSIDGVEPYSPKTFADAIDHILVKGFSADAISRFERYNMPAEYLYLSDHAPVWVDFK